jgi:hypothetical protein
MPRLGLKSDGSRYGRALVDASCCLRLCDLMFAEGAGLPVAKYQVS